MGQLFRQYDKFDSNTFVVDYQNIYRKDFVNTSSYLLIELHLTVQRLQDILDSNKDTIRLENFPVGPPEFNAVEECWREGKLICFLVLLSFLDLIR